MRPTRRREPAPTDPVARLMVDVALAHLDHAYDYVVPAELTDQVAAGSRVRVRFAGRLVDGYVLERTAGSDHGGSLSYLERAVGGEPVLSAETAELFRAVADRWAGSFVDVVRLGVPPRHARSEGAPTDPVAPPPAPDAAGWARYRAGPAFLDAVGAGRAARAVWAALPGEQWPTRLAEAVQAALAAGRGAAVVVPDARDLARVDTALSETLGPGCHVALSAELGPGERWRRWLALRRGQVRAVVGNRAAAYAPVAELGLLAIWDDGDDLHVEQRAPYPHARDVLVLRSAQTAAALLIGGHVRTAEAQQLLESDWAHELCADRATIRAAAPQVSAAGEDVEQARDPGASAARLPSVAWRAAREALAGGRPVLVQVPRGGYVPALACVRDRTPARCPICNGPLAVTAGHAAPACRWCARTAADWICPVCGETRMRAMVVGSARTAEELGRAFPGVVVRTSGAGAVLDRVGAGPALVVCTPGAEPLADGGYGAVLLLDGWALLARPDLRAGEEALRRWANAAALTGPSAQVVVMADAGVPAVQALIRWDAGGAATRELAERAELGFPPAARMAALTGPPAGVADLLAVAVLPAGAEVIGPVPLPDGAERMIVRVPRPAGMQLAAALHAGAAARSARKAADPVRVVLDPRELF